MRTEEEIKKAINNHWKVIFNVLIPKQKGYKSMELKARAEALEWVLNESEEK